MDRFINVGLQLHIREWAGGKTPFLLVHGLASNSRTWDAVGDLLAAAGHPVIALDQRGHGLSDKPDSGYDFATITGDLYRLMETLHLQPPIVVGQSWGGNVVLEFAVRYPGLAAGYVWVDGGFINVRSRGNWEDVYLSFKPPDVTGTPRETLKQSIQAEHPDWDERGIEGMLACYETLSDGTVRPWLSMNNHMQIVRALWEQDLPALFPRVQDAVLVCPADQKQSPVRPEWLAMVEAARRSLKQAEFHWFYQTDHDIHMHRPAALAELLLNNKLW